MVQFIQYLVALFSVSPEERAYREEAQVLQTMISNARSHLKVHRDNLILERHRFLEDPSPENRANWEIAIRMVEDAEEAVAKAVKRYYDNARLRGRSAVAV